MNRHVKSIAGRLSLRPPQRRSLEILDRITEISPLRKEPDLRSALAAVRNEFPTVTDFERDFPSLCFALATGVGKTRLMGAFISYLHLSHGFNNFFVLAPNLTIYNKLIADFTPNTPKYVFRGIAEFSIGSPDLITGENYEAMAGTLFDRPGDCKVNIFNIAKINSEVRGGRSPRIKRLSEYIGESYFDYLAGLDDLVLLMDESHRYRASAGVRAINELKPVLGLELTATPMLETSRGAIPFKNVIYDYPLAKAMVDGFVKEPAVVTRRDFNPAGMSQEAIERLKLEDGIRLHEGIKVELETFARETLNPMVKPFVLVIARDTTHAAQLRELIRSQEFFEGRYKDRVIQVDSSKTGAEEDQMISRLLRVEDPNEPTEIVIHVNMLKEGWDVTNLYTIVPLRAANARILVEQSIGRGLRLPYGKRTGVNAVDRLNIVAHDKFQEIINDSNRPDSPFRLQQVVLGPNDLERKMVTVVSQPRLAIELGIEPQNPTPSTEVATTSEHLAFETPEERKVAQVAYAVIRKMENQPQRLPSVTYLQKPEVQAELVKAVSAQYRPEQPVLAGIAEPPDIAAIVAKAAERVALGTIDIPRILVVPKTAIRSGFKPFSLELDTLRYAPPGEDLWVQYLASTKFEVVALGKGGIEEVRPEDYIVSGLVDFDDVAYDDHADMLYDLGAQVVRHLRGYLQEEDVQKVLRLHQRDIARFVHAQMQDHYWEEPVEYDVVVSKGFTELRESSYAVPYDETALDFRTSPLDKSNIARYLFSGFQRCLYPLQKFQSDTERQLAVILDRDALKWFRPAKGQFHIFYKWGTEHPEYQPDFCAESEDFVYMLETKAKGEMEHPVVIAKRDVAVRWCTNASAHANSYGGKSWKYVLISHDALAENMTLTGLAERFAI